MWRNFDYRNPVKYDRELIKSYTKDDFRIEWFSGTGAGGQHRNKHQNCCRITHKESGIVCVGQTHRERRRNQSEAMKHMAEKLVEMYHKTVKPRNTNEEVIRTYHEPDNRVTDKASGLQMTYKEIVEDNNIEPMLNARKGVKLENE